ncbi:unnamed protein product, partial [marine sediment metagenome]
SPTGLAMISLNNSRIEAGVADGMKGVLVFVREGDGV